MKERKKQIRFLDLHLSAVEAGRKEMNTVTYVNKKGNTLLRNTRGLEKAQLRKIRKFKTSNYINKKIYKAQN